MIFEIWLLFARRYACVDGVDGRQLSARRVRSLIGFFDEDRGHVELSVPFAEAKYADVPFVRPPDEGSALHAKTAASLGRCHPVRTRLGHVMSVKRATLYTLRSQHYEYVSLSRVHPVRARRGHVMSAKRATLYTLRSQHTCFSR